jgi:hypothetical protein
MRGHVGFDPEKKNRHFSQEFMGFSGKEESKTVLLFLINDSRIEHRLQKVNMQRCNGDEYWSHDARGICAEIATSKLHLHLGPIAPTLVNLTVC